MKSANYKLVRKIGLFPAANIVVANIIGAGIFTTTGFLMDNLGNAAVMLSLWFIGGIIAFCGALAFGELGATFPEAGGEYFFISKLFNPLLGFLSGWLSLIVGFSAPIAASAIGSTEYFSLAFPQVQEWVLHFGLFSAETFKKVLAISLILVFTIIHSHGVVFGSKVQNVLTILKVLLITLLIIAGFAFGEGDFKNLGDSGSFNFTFDGWKSVGLSLMFVMFAYSGWNSSTYIGSEIIAPQKVIPRSLLISTGIVMVLYLFLNLFFIYAIPADELIGVPEIAGLAAGKALGSKAETIISLLICFALFSSLSAFVILGPRVYYSMATQGLFFKFAAKIHTKYKVPVGAIVLQSIISIVLVLSGTFEQILVYMGFSLGIFPLLAVLGVFKLRINGQSKLRLPGYPFIHVVFIFTGTIILILAFFERPLESSIAILTACSGIPVYYWFKMNKN